MGKKDSYHHLYRRRGWIAEKGWQNKRWLHYSYTVNLWPKTLLEVYVIVILKIWIFVYIYSYPSYVSILMRPYVCTFHLDSLLSPLKAAVPYLKFLFVWILNLVFYSVWRHIGVYKNTNSYIWNLMCNSS